MREYLFRGVVKYGLLLRMVYERTHGDWVYGNLTRTKDKFFVDEMPVDPETIGQYILRDTNDKRIFENDIVRFHYFCGGFNSDTLGYEENEREFIGVVQTDDRGFYAVPVKHFKSKREIDHRYYFAEYLQEPSEELEVIGNIFNNPELLSTGGSTC